MGNEFLSILRDVQMAHITMAGPTAADSMPADPSLLALLAAVWRRRLWVIVPVVVAAGLVMVALTFMPSMYRAATKILVEPQETAFTRPQTDTGSDRSTLDSQGVQSQVEVILSVDIARKIIEDFDLASRPEFNRSLRAQSFTDQILSLIGLGSDGSSSSSGNSDRLLSRFYSHLRAYAASDSRIITVDFKSEDRVLTAEIANAVADAYIELQRRIRQESTQEASAWLDEQIQALRIKVAEAERTVEDYRSQSGLFELQRGAENPSTLTSQQLSELSSQIVQAKSQRADAQARARLIRDLLASGRPIEASDVLNSQFIQRLSEEEVRLRAQIAELSSTLLPRHPRMRELNAQLSDLSQQIRDETDKIVRGLENEAQVAAEREQQLTESLETVKLEASDSNRMEVELRALEREAKAQRDLLESYLARYRDASARDSLAAAPADARIVSRATVPVSAFFPKPNLMLAVAIVAALVLSVAGVLGHELATAYALSGAAVAQRRAYAPGYDHDLSDERFWPEGGPRVRGAGSASPDGSQHVEASRGGVVISPDRFRRSPEPEVRYSAAFSTAIGEAWAAATQLNRPVLVTGLKRDERVGLGGIRLAEAMARDGRRIMVVDCDFESDVVASVGAKPGRKGIAELLAGDVDFGDVMFRFSNSPIHGIGAGRPKDDPAVLFRSDTFESTLDVLGGTYQAIIIVAAPITRSEVTRLVAEKCGAVVMLTEPGATTRGVERAREHYQSAGLSRFVEIAFNDLPIPAARDAKGPGSAA